MPRAPKICSYVDADGGCPNLQPCPIPGHTRKPWTGAGRKMPSNWGAIRRRILKRDPICRMPGCIAVSTEVDHIGDRDDHTDANLRGVCGPCHRERTQRQANAARRHR